MTRPTHLTIMTRFYFHLHNDVDAADREGQNFPSLDAAREAAVDYARDMAAREVQEGHLDRRHRIDVEDRNGRVLLSVGFGEVVEVRG